MNHLKRTLILMSLLLLVWHHASAQVYNTARLDRLLRTYVSDTGYVDYEVWFNNADDLADVREFVANLAEFDPSTLASENAQLAFWINTYNILAIEEVLERYPVDTIRPSILRIPERSFFTEQEHVVNGENYSLDEIENEVIRRDLANRVFTLPSTVPQKVARHCGLKLTRQRSSRPNYKSRLSASSTTLPATSLMPPPTPPA